MWLLGMGEKAFVDALTEGRFLNEADAGNHLFGGLDEVCRVDVL